MMILRVEPDRGFFEWRQVVTLIGFGFLDVPHLEAVVIASGHSLPVPYGNVTYVSATGR